MTTGHSREYGDIEVLDMRRLIRLLRGRIWALIIGLAVGAIAGLAISMLETPVFEAETRLLVLDSDAGAQTAGIDQLLDIQLNTTTYVELLRQDWFQKEALRRTGGGVSGSRILVAAATNSRIIRITTTDPDPARARDLANDMALSLMELGREMQVERYSAAETALEPQMEAARKNIQTTRKELQEAETQALPHEQAAIRRAMAEARARAESLEVEIAELETLRAASGADATPISRAQDRLAEKQMDLALEKSLISAYEDEYTALALTGSLRDQPDLVSGMLAELTAREKVYLDLLEERERLQLRSLQTTPDVIQLMPAVASSNPVRPRPLLGAVAGGLGGLILALAGVLWRAAPGEDPTPRQK